MNIPFRRSSLVALVLYSIAAIVNYDYRRKKRIEKKAPDVYQEWFNVYTLPLGALVVLRGGVWKIVFF